MILARKIKNGVFVKLNNRYADYYPEYSNYLGRALRLLKSMYGMNNSGKFLSNALIDWVLESGFIQSQCQMSIYYKYAPVGEKMLPNIMLVTVYIGILLKLLENILWVPWEIEHVTFLVFGHWFISIRIYQMRDHSNYVAQAIYATSNVAK